MTAPRRPVLILGAGINGAALARELTLRGAPVWLVDAADMASGTTAYSSRLIHGGLRYLEYGEFDLVRESLGERTRLLRLAPQFVRPLRLSIPVGRRFGGLWRSAGRFLGCPLLSAQGRDRGLWTIRAGLRLYDAYAQDPSLPRHVVESVGAASAPAVDPARFRWLASYYDAQIMYPERFTLALVADARELAREQGVEFRLYTYHEARRIGEVIEIRATLDCGGAVASVAPAAIVNATGAWVDQTLARLDAPAEPKIGGTRGSHFFTRHAGLRAALGEGGVYAEAADGRPIFILPLGEMTLVGTTDEREVADPRTVVAKDSELEYLLAGASAVFPQFRLTRDDIEFHYCGVRPLPRVSAKSTSSITRRHGLEKMIAGKTPIYSLIGGKLTTCRSLAESTARTILSDLDWPAAGDSRQRVIPGGQDYPADDVAQEATWRRLAERFGREMAEIRAIWTLCGAATESILAEAGPGQDLLPDLSFSAGFVRWVIRHETPRTLPDLVERRLMLLYHQPLTRRALASLAELLAAEGKLASTEVDGEVERTISRLADHFGKRVVSS